MMQSAILAMMQSAMLAMMQSAILAMNRYVGYDAVCIVANAHKPHFCTPQSQFHSRDPL